METADHIRLLQLTYAAQLADSVLRYERAGILEQVAAERRAERNGTGAAQAAQLGVSEPAAAFTTSAALFGCADWTVTEAAANAAGPDDAAAAEPPRDFVATAGRCLLSAMVKKAGGASPCRLYCLDPIEGMVEGLTPGADFDVQETLFEGAECRVRVRT
jgi:hypothetical protein